MNTSSNTPSRLLASFGIAALAASIGLVSSRPAHTAGGPIPVAVVNTVQSRDLDNSALQPFQASKEFATVIRSGSKVGPGIRTFVDFTVPQGKRLVIQGMSIEAHAYASSERPEATLTTQAGGVTTIHALNYFQKGIDNGTDAGFALPEQALTVYADAGTVVEVTIEGISEDFSSKEQKNGVPPPDAALTGYLVDVPQD